MLGLELFQVLSLAAFILLAGFFLVRSRRTPVQSEKTTVPEESPAQTSGESEQITVPAKSPGQASGEPQQTAVPEKSRAAKTSSDPGFSLPYKTYRLIAEGGMGSVYEAFDPALRRRVAIKRMHPEIRLDPKGKDLFLKEARIVAALHHPNIVEIFSVLETKGELFLVFEYVDGQTLDEMIRNAGRLEPQECRRLIDQVCAALEFAHSSRILHRDLKPANIMVTPGGSVKVMDFGLARQAKVTLSRLSSAAGGAGTMAYMAPEQHLGREKRPADIYSLAATLYQMLTGIDPFEGPLVRLLEQKEKMQFVPLTKAVPGIAPEADAFMRRALSPKPEDRFQSAGEFRTAFKKVLA